MQHKKLFPLARKSLFLRILQAHKAKKASVFGSFARGDAHSASDIDLLVDFEKDADLLDQVGLRDALRKFFGRKVDVLTRDSLNRHISRNILKEAVPIS